MRKLYTFLLVALLVISVSVTNAQISTHSFSQTNTVFTPITGGIVLGDATSDDQRFVDPAIPLGGIVNTGVGFPIGFNFTYNGIVFDRFAVGNNGWISLGQSALTPSVDMTSTSNLSSFLSSTATNTPAILRNRIAGMGRDLQGQTGSELRVETIGTAPNRKLVVQFTGFRRFNATGENINFQIVLNETTNVVQVIFGTCVFTATATAQSGLGGSTSADFNCRTTTTDWSATTAGPLNTSTLTFSTTVFPVSGLTYNWTPAVLCIGTPSSGTISGSTLACSGGAASLSLSGNTAGPGISLQWKSSSNIAGPFIDIPGATSATYNFSAPSTTSYYIVTVTCSNGGASANTAPFTLFVSAPTHSSVSATPVTSCSPGATFITGTASGAGGVNALLATSGTINLGIPDNNPAGISSTIVLPAVSIPTAADLKIRLNMRHTWVGDLRITLTSPCGTTLVFDRPGVPASGAGNSDNLGTASGSSPSPAVYLFDISGATILPETNTGTGFIPGGTYKPSDGSNPGFAHNWAGLTFPCGAGNWTLTLSDNAGGDVGLLVDWAILRTNNYTHTLTGPGTIVQNPATGPNNSTANFTVNAIPAGNQTYILTSTDAAGCSVSSNVSVVVNATPTITFTPPAPVICNGQIQQLTATVIPPIPQVVSGGGAITINAVGNATPYSSNIVVGGLPTTGVTIKSVTINGLAHTFPSDIDMVLQSPFGTNVILMSDAGGSTAITGRSVTFDDAAAGTVPSPIVNGTYKPTNIAGPDNFPAPGPGSITQIAPTLASFGAGDYNGAWKLFVVDDAGGDGGAITDWSITFNIPVPVTYSPITNLFTNPGATIPYDGTPTFASVYAKPSATSTYTATATRNGCTGTANVTVTVNQLPAITTQPTPATQTICAGFNVTYSVAATGTGLTYQWRKGGVNLVNGLQASGSLVSGATTNSVTLIGVLLADAGNYDVVVSGTCTPPVTSTAAALVISTAPTITTQPANATVCDGASASFSVVATGSPSPTIYQWQVSTIAVPAFTNIGAASSSPSLTVSNVTPAISGNKYRVIVTNSCGLSTTTNGTATLTVNAKPVVTASSLPARICLTDNPIALVGSPVGGSWTGIGVSGSNFVPSATALGTYTLTYSFSNSLGCANTATTIAKVEDCPERIRLLRDNALILYPNPNNGVFNIRVNSTLYNYLNMRVYASSGNLVNTRNYSGLVYGQVVPIDLSHLPSGTYMVRFFYDDGIRTSEKVFPVIIGR